MVATHDLGLGYVVGNGRRGLYYAGFASLSLLSALGLLRFSALSNVRTLDYRTRLLRVISLRSYDFSRRPDRFGLLVLWTPGS